MKNLTCFFLFFLFVAACGGSGYDHCETYWYQDSDGNWYEGGSCWDYPYYYQFDEYERSLGYDSPDELEGW
ncbi:MAG: hypothetical protein Q8P45_03335 [Candidatus Harrisonbacteria bacterium]|nr:hypothetical protein [Candidatus Harrisonbacteria bacterium]